MNKALTSPSIISDSYRSKNRMAGAVGQIYDRVMVVEQTSKNQNQIRELCDLIRAQSTTGQALTLKNLAGRVGLSPFHLQRKFKAAVGVTPRQYLEACRMETFKGELRGQKSVTTATYESGFGSSSRVYERVDSQLGMTPGAYRQGGEAVEISHACVETPFGLLIIAATDRGLCFVQFGETEEELATRLRSEFPAAHLSRLKKPFSEQFDLWAESLSAYLRGEQLRLDLPLDIRGTAFQKMVWRFLQALPAGQPQSYAEVARGIGKAKASRAVGRACGANPVALVIPCHRVLRGDGELGGYRWGLERKRQILAHERKFAPSQEKNGSLSSRIPETV